MRSAAQNRDAPCRFAHHGYVDEDFASLCGVTAGDGAAQGVRSFAQAAQKSVKPFIGVTIWKSQTQKKAAGFAPHGCNIADGAGQAFIPDYFRRVTIGEKVCSLEEPVAGQNRVASIPRTPQSRVITHSDAHGRLAWAFRDGFGVLIYAIEDWPFAGFAGIFHGLDAEQCVQYSCGPQTFLLQRTLTM